MTSDATKPNELPPLTLRQQAAVISCDAARWADSLDTGGVTVDELYRVLRMIEALAYVVERVAKDEES